MAQKYRIEKYSDNTVVLSNVRNDIGVPILGLNENLTATKVGQWYDGTVMTDAKVDGKIYLKFKGVGEYKDSYFKVNLPNDELLFLEKDTMQQMRDMSSTEILLLKMGYYKGVKLNGYYVKGDTPGSIEYYLSDTVEADDGGSVISISSIKLECFFRKDINLKYFGVENNDIINNILTNALKVSSKNKISVFIPDGIYLMDRGFLLLKDSIIRGSGRDFCKITLNALTANDEGEFFENYVFTNNTGDVQISDLEIDCNSLNISASRSSGIDNRGAGANAVYKRLRIKNAKALLPSFSGGYGITFWHGGCDNVNIEDLEFENIGQSDLGLFEMFNFTVRNIFSKNCGYMVINVESSNNSRGIRNGVVDTVYASEVGRSIISLIRNSASIGDVESVVVRNVYVDVCGKTNTDVGAIRVRGTKDCTIDTVSIGESNSVGIRVSGDWYGQKGTVVNYSNLPTSGLVSGDIYRVSSESRMYTYKNGSFQPQGLGQSDDLLKCRNLVVKNINISKIVAVVNGEGLRVQGEVFCSHDNLTFSDIYIGNSQGAGVLCTYTNRSLFNNIKIDKVNSSRGFQATLCNDLYISYGQISNIGTYGLGLTDCKDVTVDGLKILNPTTGAFYFNGSTDNVKINSCTTRDNRTTKLMINAVTIESNLPSLTPKYVISSNDIDDATGSKITIQSNIVRSKMVMFNNIGISDIASTSIKGIVNQSTAVNSISQGDITQVTIADLVGITSPDASDLATCITLTNEIKSKYGLNVVLINAMKAKDNEQTNMLNSTKTAVNTKLQVDRTSGQQAT